MADPAFRERMWAGRHDPHIDPVNRLVDELNAAGPTGAPYLPPTYGGVEATVLTVLRDPGPATQRDAGGSGFISMDNDDQTAERLAWLTAGADLTAADLMLWNAYPWYINRAPRAAELEAGVEPWLRVMALLPRLRVVVLHGQSAQAGWRRVLKRRPDAGSGLVVLRTYHPSVQALIHRDPAERARRTEHIAQTLRAASAALDRPR